MSDDLPFLVDSKTEFVIVGPFAGRDRVLVKSRGVDIDLIGLAAEGKGFERAPDVIQSFFSESRQINIAESLPIDDFEPQYDPRKSRLRFAWAGFSSVVGAKRVQHSFVERTFDIVRALKIEDKSLLELAVAPVIFNCVQANEQRLRFRRFLRATLALYLILGLIGIGFGATAYFFNKVVYQDTHKNVF